MDNGDALVIQKSGDVQNYLIDCSSACPKGGCEGKHAHIGINNIEGSVYYSSECFSGRCAHEGRENNLKNISFEEFMLWSGKSRDFLCEDKSFQLMKDYAKHWHEVEDLSERQYKAISHVIKHWSKQENKSIDLLHYRWDGWVNLASFLSNDVAEKIGGLSEFDIEKIDDFFGDPIYEASFGQDAAVFWENCWLPFARHVLKTDVTHALAAQADLAGEKEGDPEESGEDSVADNIVYLTKAGR